MQDFKRNVKLLANLSDLHGTVQEPILNTGQALD